MRYSVISYKKVNEDINSRRIDAEYFDSHYILLEKELESKNGMNLESLGVMIKHPKEIKRNYVEKGTLFLRAQNVRPLKIDLESNPVYISDKDAESLKSNLIEKEDILITRTGANYGQTAINDKENKMIASSHTFIVRSEQLNPYYLTLFLNTSYGRAFINKGMYGAAQPEIAPYYLKQIVAPRLPKLENMSEDIYKESNKLSSSAQVHYLAAEKLLFSALALDTHNIPHSLSRIKRYNDFIEANRFDAEYFQIKYEAILDAIKQLPNKPLSEIIHKPIKSVEVGSSSYTQEGVPYIRVSNLTKFGITNNNQQYISSQLYEKLCNLQPQKGDILLSKDGTPGIAYLITEEKKMILSSGIIRLKVKDPSISETYLTMVLNSLLVQSQKERDLGGSIIPHWLTSQIEKIIIPIIDENLRVEIDSLYKKSFKERLLSNKLLEAAKGAIEKAIESSEELALSWLTENLKEYNDVV